MIKLTFSYHLCEGSVHPSAKWHTLDHITKLDALGDWIGELTRLYEEELTKEEPHVPANH